MILFYAFPFLDANGFEEAVDKALIIDLREDVFTLDGDVKSPEGAGEADVLREYRTGKYYRKFTLSQVIDRAEIDSGLKDGVLRLRLPKVEAATPRKIAVQTK
jgi:HSP20 family protein